MISTLALIYLAECYWPNILAATVNVMGLAKLAQIFCYKRASLFGYRVDLLFILLRLTNLQ